MTHFEFVQALSGLIFRVLCYGLFAEHARRLCHGPFGSTPEPKAILVVKAALKILANANRTYHFRRRYL